MITKRAKRAEKGVKALRSVEEAHAAVRRAAMACEDVGQTYQKGAQGRVDWTLLREELWGMGHSVGRIEKDAAAYAKKATGRPVRKKP